MARIGRTLELPVLGRMPTGVPGLDDVLGGGLPAGRSCLIAGFPGTGKTTLGNQMAFSHAASGGSVIYATIHAETHDVMLANLRDFISYDSSIPGDRIRYLNLLSTLNSDGLDGVLTTLRREAQAVSATLLLIDSSIVGDELAPSSIDLRRFAQLIEVQSALLDCTSVLLLNSERPEQLQPLAAHANGVIMLSNALLDSRHVRLLEVTKLRGAEHLDGVHEFSITRRGVTVHPRLESLVGRKRPPERPVEKLETGVRGLDAMLGGGLVARSSTLVIGTPGAGKTLLGLSFVAAGAAQGQRGLIVGFHETEDELMSTGNGIGLGLEAHISSQQVQVQWNPPLDVSADAWAWRLLARVEADRPQRVFIDAVTDVQRFFSSPRRLSAFLVALTNELRAQGTTVIFAAEIDAYVDDRLIVPVPAASATMDNAILLRHIELRSELRRLVCVLKARQAATEYGIRELVIGEDGISVSEPFSGVSRLLTGRAMPAVSPEAGSIS